jgi:hypothetical protein
MKSTDGFVKQPDNPGSSLNTDLAGLKAYKLRKQKEQQKENEINNLKQELSEIKDLLLKLIDNRTDK